MSQEWLTYDYRSTWYSTDICWRILFVYTLNTLNPCIGRRFKVTVNILNILYYYLYKIYLTLSRKPHSLSYWTSEISTERLSIEKIGLSYFCYFGTRSGKMDPKERGTVDVMYISFNTSEPPKSKWINERRRRTLGYCKRKWDDYILIWLYFFFSNSLSIL